MSTGEVAEFDGVPDELGWHVDYTKEINVSGYYSLLSMQDTIDIFDQTYACVTVPASKDVTDADTEGFIVMFVNNGTARDYAKVHNIDPRYTPVVRSTTDAMDISKRVVLHSGLVCSGVMLVTVNEENRFVTSDVFYVRSSSETK